MWLCCGDFNDILSNEEKSGGNIRSFTQLSLSRNAVEDCNLLDLGFNGYPFTWSNDRQGSGRIQCRLDRVFSFDEFIKWFSPIQINHLARFGSDHVAISIELDVCLEDAHKKKLHVFRFEKCWADDERCEAMVRGSWNNVTGLVSKIEAMQSLNYEFKEYRTSEIRKELLEIETQLNNHGLWDGSLDNITKFRELEAKHSELLQTEETMWRQRSRATWLKERDKNSKFFHAKTKQRGNINSIKKLKDNRGVWWNGRDKVEKVLVDYFVGLFTSSNPTTVEQTCLVVKDRLSLEHVEWCNRSFSPAEIKEVIDQMHPHKALGPNGLPALFFRKYQHIVGSEVVSLTLGILNEGKSPECINKTFIALIPECKNLSSLNQFRSISLCNVVMKIVTKTIANRLKPILPEIVDEEQSAFVQGRLITDNALISMECFHWMKKKTKGKKGVMTMKLDMAKAYDRIEWSFVQSMLHSMNFPENIINTILQCISTVSYQILINGQPSRRFFPERGLRQGNPLSPYLFILCANVLSGLLKKEEKENKIHGIRIARNAPKITHLLFADDSLLFAMSSVEEA